MVELSWQDMALRIGLALGLGLVLGYEREQHGRAAGMRTTMLVCVAAAVAMLLSEGLFLKSGLPGAAWRPDPARLAAGVLAGMGFLGAGVIIQQNNSVYGVTTAAVLWFSAILGMAFGAGFITLGLMGFAVVLVALFVLPGVESMIHSDRYADMEVSTGLGGPSPGDLHDMVKASGLKVSIKPIGLEVDLQARQRVMRFSVKTKKHLAVGVQAVLVERLAGLKGVRKVRWF